MLDDFVVRALVGGVGVALAAGPLGCLVVWRRMAYFGDSLAHAALLGVALGAAIGASPTLGVAAAGVAFALALAWLQKRRELGGDALLGLLSHTALAAGMIVISFVAPARMNLMVYLFGDILAVGRGDLIWIYGGGAAVLAVLAALWRPLLATTLSEDLARAEGVNVGAMRLVATLLLAVVVAGAMKIVGVLMITALLIVPAAAARQFARTPEAMALSAAAVGALSVLAGVAGSLRWDSPTGPSIVLAAFLLFAAAAAVSAYIQRRTRAL